MRLLTGHTKPMRSVAYLPNGNLVSGSEDRTVRIWDSSTWECIRTIKARTPVYALAISPDGNTIAYAGKQPSNNPNVVLIRTYDSELESFGTPFEFFRAQGESVWKLSFSSDGEFLIASGRITGKHTEGGKAMLFSASNTGARIPIVPTLRVYSVRFAPQDLRYAINAKNKCLFYDGIHSKEPTVSYDLRTMWPGDVIFLPDSPLAVVAGGKYLFF